MIPNHVQVTGNERPTDKVKWVSSEPIPQVGKRILVTMNNFGYGIVSGYSVQGNSDTDAGYLGVVVQLENPPKWFVKQCQLNKKELVGTFFGTEIKGV